MRFNVLPVGPPSFPKSKGISAGSAPCHKHSRLNDFKGGLVMTGIQCVPQECKHQEKDNYHKKLAGN